MESPRASIQEKIERTKNGKPRATRPDGSYYSSDPKERHAQLVEDGKIGAKGSELAKEQGKLGGRPRNVSAQALVAEKAREEAELVYKSLSAGMRTDSVKQQRDSATAVLEWEEKYMRREERQQDASEKVDKDAIIQMLVEKLTGKTAAARALRTRLDAVEEVPADAEVIERYGISSRSED